jgi:superfamily II DNA helicase RecQ
MKLFIDSKGASGSLHLKISGFLIDLSDISSTGQVAVIEESGNVSIEVLPVEEKAYVDKVTEPLLDNLQEVEKVEPFSEAVTEGLDVSPDLLFQKLVDLRKQIAKEEKLPPYIIFHDTSLKDMVSKLPIDLESMKGVSGVGYTKLEKYGIRFVEAIKDYLAKSA